MISENYRSLSLNEANIASGHLWEQLVLPGALSTPLLNFCNTAPVIRCRQIVCIHDANVFNLPASHSASFRLAYRTLLPLVALRSAVVATVSQCSADELAPLAAAFPGTWGEGIVDEGPDFADSNPRWDNIDDDELIFYAPVLASESQDGRRSRRLASRLLSAVAFRVWQCLNGLLLLSDRWSRQELLAEIDRLGILQGWNAEEAAEFGATQAPAWIGNALFKKLNKSPLLGFQHSRGVDSGHVLLTCKLHEFESFPC